MTYPGRLWTHVVALGLILCALVPLLDNGAVVSADEGAVLSTLELLHSKGSWSMPNPAADVDPDGRWFGIDLSDRTGDDFFPYAKHAAYPAAMSPLYAIGGQRLVIWASAAGTLAAAAMGALIARRVRPGLDIPTLWVIGLVSPLFFDSFWVIAHSIGAAFAALAVWAALGTVGDRRARLLPIVALGVAGAALFRSEGTLYGLALGAAVGLFGLVRRDRLAIAGGMLAGAAAVGCWWLDGEIYSAIVGTVLEPFRIQNAPTESWFTNRLHGAWASLVRPQLLDATTAGSIFLGIAVLIVAAAGYVRWKPQETGLIRGASVVAGGAALAALAFRVAPVPGLLVAFPLLPVGLVLTTRSTLETTASKLILGSSGLFALAVVATQYKVGGSMEWGGRFFHLALPALVPVLLLAVNAAGQRLDPLTRRFAAGSLAVVSAVLLVFAVGSIVRIHDVTDDLVDSIVTMSHSTSSADDAGGPVVVSNMEAVGRLSWREAVTSRYLRVVEGDDLRTVARRLDAAGVDEFVFAAAYHQVHDRARLVGYEPVPGRTVEVGGWELSVMRRV